MPGGIHTQPRHALLRSVWAVPLYLCIRLKGDLSVAGKNETPSSSRGSLLSQHQVPKRCLTMIGYSAIALAAHTPCRLYPHGWLSSINPRSVADVSHTTKASGQFLRHKAAKRQAQFRRPTSPGTPSQTQPCFWAKARVKHGRNEALLDACLFASTKSRLLISLSSARPPAAEWSRGTKDARATHPTGRRGSVGRQRLRRSGMEAPAKAATNHVAGLLSRSHAEVQLRQDCFGCGFPGRSHTRRQRSTRDDGKRRTKDAPYSIY